MYVLAKLTPGVLNKNTFCRAAGMAPPGKSIIYQPELSLYYEDFGSGPADNCLVAETDGKVVGAVWTRIMNDYGHVTDDTPSFTISLYREYRDKGIGTEMMKNILWFGNYEKRFDREYHQTPHNRNGG